MKIKRFHAPDMRQALRQVREVLGPDAVILSNRKMADGMELVAAVDFDEQSLAAGAEQMAPEAEKPTPKRPAPKPERIAVAGGYTMHGKPLKPARPLETRTCVKSRVAESANEERVSASRNAVAEASLAEGSRKPAQQDRPSEGDNLILLEVRREMESIRRMMKTEYVIRGWEDMGRKQPDTQELFRRLMSLGLSADLCHGLASKVAKVEDVDKAWRKSLAILAASLPVFQDNLLDEGGAVALVGPTGVGKTTTLAKLAARFCLRHGNRHLGLISADGYRLGGQDQLLQYARLLDVPVRSVNSVEELEIALNAFADKRLVLVDTAGMGQRDARLREQLALLGAERRKVRTLLAIASNTQQAALEQTMLAFKPANPAACVITKVDEAASLGGVFSALIRQGMPLAYIADGQKVPEDLHLPRTQALVNRAVNMSQQYAIGQSEQYMALSLGEVNADARA